MKRDALIVAAVAVLTCGCVHVPSGGSCEVRHYQNGGVCFKASRDSEGRFHGKILSFFASGRLAEESRWEHGKPAAGKFYNEKGVLISEIKRGTGWRHCPGHSEYYDGGDYVRGFH